MAFLSLRKEATFDATDGEGRIVHPLTGECFALDRVATLILQASLDTSSREEALAFLRLRVEASDQQLEASLDTMRRHLLILDLLGTEGERLSVISSFPQRGFNEAPGIANSWVSERVHTQGYSQRNNLDWEVFLTGTITNTSLPNLSARQRVYALWKTATTLLIFFSPLCATWLFRCLSLSQQAQRVQAHQWRTLCTTLATLRRSGCIEWSEKERETLVRFARRELVYCQCLTRLLAPLARCLVRSVAFTRYLRALGLDAHLIIGRERFDIPKDFALHAWVELAGQVVNDSEELQSGYAVLYRVPAKPAAEVSLPEI